MAFLFLPSCKNSNRNDFSVFVFDIISGKPSLAASGRVPSPVTENMIVANDLVMVARSKTTDASPVIRADSSRTILVDTDLAPTVDLSRLVRYQIDGDSIRQVAELELVADFDLDIEVAADGKSAIIVGEQQTATATVIGIEPVAGFSVSLIDLSKDQPELFQTIPIATRRTL